MANIENLIPFTSEQDREKAKINGKKGGVASGIAKRRAKGMKECLQFLMNLDIKNEKAKDQLRSLGVPDEMLTNETLMMVNAMQKANKGDIQAMNFIRDTSGQRPVEIQEVRERPIINDDIK